MSGVDPLADQPFKSYVTPVFLSLVALLAILTAGLGEAQQDGLINNKPLKATSFLAIDPLPQGANSALRIDMELAPEFHAYLDKFKVQITNPEGLQISKFNITPVVEFEDVFTKKMKQGVKGISQIHTVLNVPPGFPVGPVDGILEITYQACTKEYCLLPKRLPVPLSFTVAKGDAAIGGTTSSQDDSLLAQAKSKGWLFVFLMVFLGGVLTCFTPCIFPMIPITLAVIGATGTHHSRWQNFRVSIFYVLGIALTYSTLGVVAALTGSLFGSLLGHPLVAMGFALLFLLMALSMYGLFEIQAPAFVRNRLGTHQSKSRYIGALLSGLIAGIVASPCVGPVLIGVLAFVAQSQDPLMGFALLFTFALGMGQLFLVLGFSSQLIQKIPKAGPWMNFTKFIFGTAMVALALFYVHPVVGDRVFDGLLGIALVAVCAFHGAFSPIKKLTLTKSLIQGAMIAGILVGGVFLVRAGFPQYFDGLNPDETRALHEQGGWLPFSDETLQQAHMDGKPVIVDFYADWCAACKELESITFMDKDVMEEGKKFVLMRFDATKMTPEFDVLKEKFNILGLPTIVFHDGKTWRTDLTLTGFESGPEFLKRMKQVF
ncbi:MAG: protein-disulfide reductase DsbD [Bdellovibrionaceae bacterium]|nr:protein-disulfide reductase DsbD [Bdellovibrionales bacterium]MCB9084812.1 protein-disulfide reductase DsbD [Pseudobdellovibrionaceae bacterium]